jgi:tetratricopeptide (TPR) repeat protein
MPHREDLVFDYLSLAARAGAVERARAAYDLLARQASRLAPEHLADARRVLFDAELTRWQRGLQGPEDYGEALAHLDELLARAPDEATRQEWANERRELARTVERNRLVEVFNRAVALANGGRPDEARALLQEVVASPLDPLLAMAAQHLLHELER